MAGYGLQVTGYEQIYGWTDIHTDRRMDRETCRLKYYFRWYILETFIQSLDMDSLLLVIRHNRMRTKTHVEHRSLFLI